MKRNGFVGGNGKGFGCEGQQGIQVVERMEEDRGLGGRIDGKGLHCDDDDDDWVGRENV
jgi:hypothetical protein